MFYSLLCRDFTQAKEVLETGEYMCIKLRGNVTFSYINSTLDERNPVRDTFWWPNDLLSTDQSEDLL